METTQLTVHEDKKEQEHVKRVYDRPSRFDKIDKVLEVGGFDVLVNTLLYCLESGVQEKDFMERGYASIIVELIQCITDLQNECYSDHVTLWGRCGIKYDNDVNGWDYRGII